MALFCHSLRLRIRTFLHPSQNSRFFPSRRHGKVVPMVGKQYDPKTFPLTPEVQKAGISEEDWDAICESLRKGKGMTGIGGGFSKAIVSANETYFDKCGLEAT